MSLKNSTQEKNFNQRLTYAEKKVICECLVVYKLYKGEDEDKMFECSS